MGLVLMCASTLAGPQMFAGKDERKGKKTSNTSTLLSCIFTQVKNLHVSNLYHLNSKYS